MAIINLYSNLTKKINESLYYLIREDVLFNITINSEFYHFFSKIIYYFEKIKIYSLIILLNIISIIMNMV